MFGRSRHRRFLLAFAAGMAVALASAGLQLGADLRLLIGFDAFALLYLALMLRLALQSDAASLAAHAAEDDEGIVLILTLALMAVVASFAAILLVLNRPGATDPLAVALALAAVPLGWLVVQTLAAFRYSHLYYSGPVPGGLRFADTRHPGPWEFIYLSTGIGMTAQVSDVVVTDTPMRRVVTFHATCAFFYNTIILALAVNAALALFDGR